ncbi:tetratricopeptide repeat protein [Gordonia aichiensis]|uniref:MalT-like TPR region domain-containing protein n=1 Tax=Gordonia aichiensis NBRC 108223 TaxID=1220583 RepID=L7KQZ9_9ACTN|nr:tetratricopeptide repeat protein [Gordonia aichiensis]GAC50387.1 hypothetical protein GOACH_24_00080 [Gordonia aichiensis NBRC 108223]
MTTSHSHDGDGSPDDVDTEYEEWSRRLDELDARAEAAMESGDDKAIGVSYVDLAEHLAGAAENGVVIELLLTAREAFLTHDPESAANCAAGIGYLAQSIGDYETAFGAFDTASEEWESLGELRLMADADSNVGAMATRLGEYETADTYLRSAIMYYIDHGLLDDAQQSMVNLANNLLLAGDPKEAETILTDLLAGFRPDSEEYAKCLASLASIYATSSRIEEARRNLDSASAIFESLGRSDDAQDTQMTLSHVLLTAGQYSRAIDIATRSREYYAQQDRHDKTAVCDYNLANYYTITGDYSAADVAFSRAFEGLRAAGQHHHIANLQWNRTKRLLMEAAVNARERAQLSKDAFDTAVSSLVALEHQRFQFTQARDRVKWSETLADRLATTFAMAEQLGRRDLVADLIETGINAGVYHGGSSDPSSFQHDLIPMDSDPPQFAVEDTPAAITHGSVSILLSDSLPMSPPPTLVSGSTGEPILKHQRELAASLDPKLDQVLAGVPSVPLW